VDRSTLAVVVPCFNEEAVIDAFLADLLDVLDGLPDIDARIFVVDDGSTDSSLDRLNAFARRDARVLVYALSRNFGHQNALSAGLDVCDGDAVIMMDSDLQHPPALLPTLIARWREGFDVVSTARRDTADSTLFKRLTANTFYWVINQLSETPIMPGGADFCLLSRCAHHALRSMPERHRFLRGMVSWIGFRRAVVPFDAPARSAGRSKYTTFRMLSFALDALFSFTAAPMKVAARLGVLLVNVGVVYLAVILVRYFRYDDLVPGWGSLASIILILGGVQLAFIGLIGEYLARVFDEAKGRPLYVFKQKPHLDPARSSRDVTVLSR
jgi:glycosyltransferase involved in cell wall biosynthesis